LHYTNIVKALDPNSSASQNPAFSLIELLLVIAIIAVLSTLFFSFNSPSHQRIAQKSCESNLQKIFIAMDIYARDDAEKFPAVSNAVTSEEPMQLLVPKYSADTSIFICPGSKDAPLLSGEPLTKHKISYAYYMGQSRGVAQSALMSDAQVNTNSKAVGEQIFSTTGKAPGNNHSKFGGNVLFGDGHVEMTPARLAFSLVVTQGVILLNPSREK
jgi:prepilin-type N-terminal cleavage/methylation domain-containing protein/prepilin-type processing-associated H-X9-DG protein